MPFFVVPLPFSASSSGCFATTAATDILLVDPYPIGIDTKGCTGWYGCCGCDDCVGSVLDVSTRLETVAAAIGGIRPLGLVAQAFGGEHHWARMPTGAELRVMSYLGLIAAGPAAAVAGIGDRAHHHRHRHLM